MINPDLKIDLQVNCGQLENRYGTLLTRFKILRNEHYFEGSLFTTKTHYAVHQGLLYFTMNHPHAQKISNTTSGVNKASGNLIY